MGDIERNNYKTISDSDRILSIEILTAAALILTRKVHKTVVRPALLNGALTRAMTRGQEA